MSTQQIGLEGIVSDVEFTQLQVYSESPITIFDYAISSTEGLGQPQVNTVVVHLPTLFANLEIEVLENSLISEYETNSFEDEAPSLVKFGYSTLNFTIYPNSIESTANLIAEVTPPLLIYPQTIYLDDILNDYSSIEIQTYSSNTIDEFLTSISSSVSFDEELVVRVVTNLESVDPTTEFGTSKLNLTIYLNSVESTEVIGDIVQLGMEITDVPFPSIESTLLFGSSKLNRNLLPSSIESEHSVSDSNKLNQNIRSPEWISSISFGDFTQLNMEIEDVPFPSIESTVEIPNPTIKLFVGPLSIAPTVNFGTSNFIDNIHRLLVFKDDNISKVGTNDAVVIAGGIRLNPSSTIHEATELPATPVGFLSVNINGTDYKIPYYAS